MRTLFRTIIINGLAIFFTAQILPGLQIKSEVESYLTIAVFYSVIYALISPIISLISLPLTILTLGLFASVNIIITLFILTRLYDGISVVPFTFPGLQVFGYGVGSFYAPGPLSYLLISVIIFIIVRIANWLYDA